MAWIAFRLETSYKTHGPMVDVVAYELSQDVDNPYERVVDRRSFATPAQAHEALNMNERRRWIVEINKKIGYR